jgi:hypothetical protein
MKAWPGVRLFITSVPIARARAASVKDFTTGTATSASSRAMRTWRSVSAMFSSVSRPRPRRASMAWPSRLLSVSNMRRL